MTARTAWIIGPDVPLSLARAAGLRAVRATLDSLPSPRELPAGDCVVFGHASTSYAQAYHRLRVVAPDANLIFLDLAVGEDAAVEEYCARRFAQVAQRLEQCGGRAIDPAELHAMLLTEWAAAEAETHALAENGVDDTSQVAVLVGVADATGLDAPTPGVLWAEDAHGYGRPVPDWLEEARSKPQDVWGAAARMHLRRSATTSRASARKRADAVLDHARGVAATRIVWAGESPRTDADAWFLSALQAAAAGEFDLIGFAERREVRSSSAAAPPASTTGSTVARPRARKSLTVTRAFGDYQREWFAGIRDRAAAGEPFAVVNADAPQEVLRALDIPFVVNQWWASIAAAKGGARRGAEALRAAGLPHRHESYNSQGIADFLADDEDAPWGGLPVPQLLAAVRGEDAIAAIFEEWSRLTGAELVLYDRTVESRAEFTTDWWDALPEHWDAELEPERLDLMTAQIRGFIAAAERVSGRDLDPRRLQNVLDLVNEQEEWYRRTRDLIAATSPAPVGIVDTIPATMIPQWHRGTEWGRDAAKAFHDEVVARVEAGESVCPEERIRVMWVGRGMWQHMWLYQAFEQSHGAVFVWSMYLGLAADGYLRYLAEGQDPLRSLAARFVTVGDELRMPTWAAAWHVSEARRHGVHAVVAVDDAEPAVLAALEAAGFPVLRLGVDNLVSDIDEIERRIGRFFDSLSE